MRSPIIPAALLPGTLALLGVPATLANRIPPWLLVVLVAATIALAALEAVVTQIIRLSTSTKITRSEDAVAVINHHRRRR